MRFKRTAVVILSPASLRNGMQKNSFIPWLIRSTILALAILVVAKSGIVEGIHCRDGLTLAVVVVLLSLLNALLRPLLLLVAMPLIVASFGLLLIPAIWVINAVILYLVGHTFRLDGFSVDTFGAAMWASLWISIIAFLLGKLFGGDDTKRAAPGKIKDDSDVIDV